MVVTFAMGTLAALTTCAVPSPSHPTRFLTSRSLVSHDGLCVQRRATRQASTSEPFIQKPFSQEPKVCNTPPVCLSKSGLKVLINSCFCICCSSVGANKASCSSSCRVSSSKKPALLSTNSLDTL